MVHPKRVEFQRPESQRKMYESYFQWSVKFNARRNVLVFDKEDVDRPFLTHNAELLALIAPQLESELSQQLAQKSLSEQVKGIVKKLLAGQRPTFEGRGAGITVEHADAATPPQCGSCEVPAVDGRSATRTRATLLTAFQAGVERNRLSSRLRGCKLIFSGFSPVGGHLEPRAGFGCLI
jgi:Arabinose-binding domain of AraC transcription regulator, N-term